MNIQEIQRRGNKYYHESEANPLILLVLFGYTILVCLYLLGIVIKAVCATAKDIVELRINTRPEG